MCRLFSYLLGEAIIDEIRQLNQISFFELSLLQEATLYVFEVNNDDTKVTPESIVPSSDELPTSFFSSTIYSVDLAIKSGSYYHCYTAPCYSLQTRQIDTATCMVIFFMFTSDTNWSSISRKSHHQMQFRLLKKQNINQP